MAYHENEAGVTEAERLAALLDVWKKTVDVQQHFNDLAWRIRGLALTVVTIALGATGLAIQKDTSIPILGWRANASGIILLGAAAIWFAFYFVDRVWYHPLLIGAVKAGAEMEEALKESVPQAVLGARISSESAVDPTWLTSFWVRNPRKGDEEKKLHSDDKLRIFYWSVFAILLIIGVALLFSSPQMTGSSNPASAGTTATSPATPSLPVAPPTANPSRSASHGASQTSSPTASR